MGRLLWGAGCAAMHKGIVPVPCCLLSSAHSLGHLLDVCRLHQSAGKESCRKAENDSI